MTRWLHPPELERQRKQARFDPVVEGARHGLSREVSLAIWERVCADATDSAGVCDIVQAQRRFHEIAARIAARGGRLRPDPGRLTRVGTEISGTPLDAWRLPELAPRIPGRETLVTAEARRWSARSAEFGEAPASTEAVDGPEREGGVADRRERPRASSERLHADEVAQALASLQLPLPPDPAGASDALGRSGARRGFGLDLRVWTPPGREPRDERLPAATLARMEQAYGQRFDDVELHTDSAEVPAGQQAFTRERHIFFRRGAFDPESEHGEHVIAHELAHVAQQRRPASGDRHPTRAALESDAHQAALAALAGRAASVNLFVPAAVALGFSNGEPEQRPAAPSAPDRAPGQSARDGAPAPASAGPPAPGGPRPASPTHAPTSAGPGSTGERSGAPPPPGAARSAAASPEAAVPRRGANADGLLVPEAPSALTPAAAGRLQTIRTDNQGVAAATTALPTAQQQTDIARAAVVEPQAEQDAHAQHGVVAALDDRPPPSPEIEQACARIRQVIRDKRPPSEDKLVDAKPKEMAQEAGAAMSAGVEQRAGTVRQGYADMQQSPQGTPNTTPVPATLPPEQAQTPPVDAAAGAPDPLTHNDVSLDGDVAAQQQKIRDAGMNTEAGQLVQDGPIGDARGGVGDLQEMAKTDPQKVLADQAAAVAQAKDDMRALQTAAEKALADARAGAVGQMATHTTTVQGSEEQQRAAAGAQMQAIFTRTQRSVDTLLQPLSKNAVARWEAGVAQLSTDFESSLAEVKHKIDERHSGIGGWFVSGWDHLAGLPDWVTKNYDRAEARFGDGATSLITDISRDVNQVIDDCKKLIDQARKDIEAIVKSLPASLQSWAQGEANRLGQQLDQLSQKVDQTQKGLNQDLVNRTNGAVQTVRERVADLREQAKGLLNKIADALIEFAKNPAKAIIDGLIRLLAIPPASFWALVDRLGNVISGIAADPMKFANTLMSGVGQGFRQFADNFWPTHFGQSLFQWLFSKMSDAGIQMPLDFTMPSIVTLVLQIMGITWTRIKTILAKHIGEKNVEVLDQAHQLIGTLISRGPLGVYHLILPELNPEMILDAIKNAAISYVMETIITKVVFRIVMMLNPAGAILQAIEAIYRVIKWVIDNAARIFTLIEAVVNGAAQILAGNVKGVADLVERALGLLIIPVMDFVADWLGLSGIPQALKKVIMGLQSKIEQILDKVTGFIVEKAKALWQAIKNRGKSNDSKDDKKDDDKKDDDKKGGKQEVGETINFEAAKHGHRMWIAVEGSKATVMVASTPTPVAQQLEQMRAQVSTLPKEKQAIATSLLASADATLQKTSSQANQAVQSQEPAKGQRVKTEEHSLADLMKQLFEVFGLNDGPVLDMPVQMNTHGHTLYVSVQGRKLLVELASRRAVLFTLASNAIDKEKKGANRAALIQDLGEIQNHLKELMEFEKAGNYSTMPFDEIKRATERVAIVLVQIGKEFKIDDLENLGHPSKYVEGNMLKEEYRSVVRKKFYGTSYRGDTDTWKANRLKTLINPNDPTQFKDELQGTWEPRDRDGKKDFNVTIDHEHKVYEHWNAEGNNQFQTDRLDFYNATADLRLTAWNNNSADGAKATAEGGRYLPNVGPKFRGPGEKE